MSTPAGDEEHGLSLEEIAAEAHKHRSSGPPAKTTAATTATPPVAPRAQQPPQDGLEHHDDYDDALLHRAVADAGRWAYGTVLVEVWVKRSTTLVRPTSGWWLDPVIHSEPGDQMSRLTDTSREDYVPPAALVPGEGLPGVLWAELEGGNMAVGGRFMRTVSRGGTTTRTGFGRGIFGQIQQQHHERQRQSTNVSVRSGGSGGGGPVSKRRGHRRAATSTELPTGSADIGGGRGRGHGRAATSIDNDVFATAMAVEEEFPESDETPMVVPTVVWRDVKALAADPDQPWNPRLQLLAACNLGWAAAVPLRRHGQDPHGLVIYMARTGVDGTRLRSPTNEAYLASAADLIASALLMRGPRHAAMHERQIELKQTIARVRRRILFLVRAGHDLQAIASGKVDAAGIPMPSSPGGKADETTTLRPDDSQLEGANAALGFVGEQCMWIKSRLWNTLLKTRGGAVQAPPPFSMMQTLHTFVAVFLTIAAMCFLNTHMVSNHGRDRLVVLGPFGALVTLLFGLTAAPASQPRNAMLGQSVSIGIVLLLQYIPGWEEMQLEWRASLSTALAVAAMVRLGLTHPPAGAAAFLFALAPKVLRGSHLGVLLLCNLICIGMATVLNNLSDRRQYPTFWGFPLDRYIAQCREKPAEKEV